MKYAKVGETNTLTDTWQRKMWSVDWWRAGIKQPVTFYEQTHSARRQWSTKDKKLLRRRRHWHTHLWALHTDATHSLTHNYLLLLLNYMHWSIRPSIRTCRRNLPLTICTFTNSSSHSWIQLPCDWRSVLQLHESSRVCPDSKNICDWTHGHMVQLWSTEARY